MATKSKKNDVGFFRSRFMTVVLAVSIIWVVCIIWSQSSDMSALQTEQENYNKQIQDEKERKEHIEKQKNKQNDEQRVEQAAREMGMVKPGEIVFTDVSK
ncbi:MAG: septum formation initiator family protein [Clostridia bacterium]|nr:septum formation initiator family protein [Clostridia bacterium]